jgi:hypothetical protein
MCPAETYAQSTSASPHETNSEQAVVNELLAIAIDKLAEHYQVNGDYLRNALLIRGVAELSAVTDRSKPATPEDLEQTLTTMNKQLDEILGRFRKQAIEIDEAVQHANITLAVVDQVNARLRGEMAQDRN